MLTGDNGILKNAQSAKSKTSEAEDKEIIQLAYQGAKISNFENETDTIVGKLEAQLISEGVTGAAVTIMGTRGALVTMPSGRKFKVTSTGEVTLSSSEIYKDGDYKVKIPEGCEVSSKEDEKHVNTGLVIIDSNDNEWVFVPCTINEYSSATNQKSSWSSHEYTNKTWSDSEAFNIGKASLEKLAEEGLTTGFYVSRYEAGIPKEASFYANSNGASYTGTYLQGDSALNARNTTTIAPVSKKGVQAWNSISQTKAKEIAQLMYTGGEGQSYLIDSYAWDTICKKMIETQGSSAVTTDSKDIGNYYNTPTTKYSGLNVLHAVHTYNNGWIKASEYKKGTISGAPGGSGTNRLELATGSLESAKINNIYDIAGNMWEWTTEISTGQYSGNAVLRGGSFFYKGSDDPAVRRNGNDSASGCYLYAGFRAVLYL